MGRKHLFEFEDQPWFPDVIRTCMTDFLSFIGNAWQGPYEEFVPRLAQAMRYMQTEQLLDLCSGGSGPVITVSRLLRDQGIDVDARLTDLYPNVDKFEHTRQVTGGRVQYIRESVDATDVSPELDGFRIIFNAFHHFRPDMARAILADAVRQRRGIAIFELLARLPAGVALSAFIPMALAAGTPFIRPFRWSRLALTYPLPLVPLFTAWDGFASSFRIYSPDELWQLVGSIHAPDYEWDIQRTYYPGSPVPATTLIGVPRTP